MWAAREAVGLERDRGLGTMLPHIIKDPKTYPETVHVNGNSQQDFLVDSCIYPVSWFSSQLSLKSVLNTQGLLSRPVLVKTVLLFTATNLDAYSLFKAQSEDSCVLHVSDWN